MGSTALKIALAWTPFLVLWTLVTRIGADVGILLALRSGLVGIGTAALLGQVVWWATGRFPWPDRLRPRFYVLHALMGGAYAAFWLVGSEGVATLVRGEIPGTDVLRVWRWENAGWRILMGLWLYGLVAGVSYTLRIRTRLLEQQRAAARLEALATRARLESLRARLEPHFLFNALNTVAALIPQDPAAAERAVERLGGLLRYSLSESDRPVSLAEEWAFTLDYLELERLRLDERLRLTLDLEPATLGVAVPPLSVQTLVENTVRHAVAPREEGATLRVAARLEDGKLIVDVQDDGPGCDPAGLAAAAGTGLRNLEERIRGAYGGRGSLSVHTAPGGGFAVRMEVPVDAAR